MTKTESIVVGIVLGMVCPALLFILFWWITATLVISQILDIPEGLISTMAITGLGLGAILDALYLKKWVSRFYDADMRVMILFYVACSVVAVASFMGVPIANVALGTLAGVYIGRRAYHAGQSDDAVAKTLTRSSRFIAGVTGLEALPIGLLVLNEPGVMAWLHNVTGMDAGAITGPLGVGLIIALCVVLIIVQFLCTRTAARIAFGIGRRASA